MAKQCKIDEYHYNRNFLKRKRKEKKKRNKKRETSNGIYFQMKFCYGK